MKFNFDVNKIDLNMAGYGDVIILDNGSKYLIIKDKDGRDYLGLNLVTLTPTYCEESIPKIFEEIAGTVVNIIKSESLVMGAK